MTSVDTSVRFAVMLFSELFKKMEEGPRKVGPDGKPVDTVAVIFQIEKIGYSNMDTKALLRIVKLFQVAFVERLGMAMLFNPGVLVRGVWKIAAPFLDPVVRSKIMITKDSKEVVQRFDPRMCPDEVEWGLRDSLIAQVEADEKAAQQDGAVGKVAAGKPDVDEDDEPAESNASGMSGEGAPAPSP